MLITEFFRSSLIPLAQRLAMFTGSDAGSSLYNRGRVKAGAPLPASRTAEATWDTLHFLVLEAWCQRAKSVDPKLVKLVTELGEQWSTMLDLALSAPKSRSARGTRANTQTSMAAMAAQVQTKLAQLHDALGNPTKTKGQWVLERVGQLPPMAKGRLNWWRTLALNSTWTDLETRYQRKNLHYLHGSNVGQQRLPELWLTLFSEDHATQAPVSPEVVSMLLKPVPEDAALLRFPLGTEAKITPEGLLHLSLTLHPLSLLPSPLLARLGVKSTADAGVPGLAPVHFHRLANVREAAGALDELNEWHNSILAKTPVFVSMAEARVNIRSRAAAQKILAGLSSEERAAVRELLAKEGA